MTEEGEDTGSGTGAEAPASEPAASSAPASARPPPADAFEKLRRSWGFPAFARDFPADPDLAVLVAAFASGDYATVRTGAPALAAKTEDAEVKRAAELLRARIEPDPTSRLFFVLTAALLIFLFGWWLTHDGPQHHAPAPAKPAPTVEFVK